MAAFGALGDATRRLIFERLADHPSAVGELAATLPVSRPAVSQHLRALKAAGLVTETSEGARRVYRLDPQGTAAMRAWLDLREERAAQPSAPRRTLLPQARSADLPDAEADSFSEPRSS
jgi:DNA-binding transcriptional ArsR family regulator